MEYEIIGEKRVINGKTFYCPGGTDNGMCYKNEQAFKENSDEVCYIPEASFMDIEPAFTEGDMFSRDFKEFFCIEDSGAYTRKDIEEACKGYVDDEDVPIDAGYMFQELDWCCPETILDGCFYLEECGQIIIE